MTNGLPQRKRFYFYRDQLVVLGCAFTLASVIIFVLGGLTGKTIAHRRMAERAASVVKIPVNLPSTELNLPPGAHAGDGAAAEKSSTNDAAAERRDDMRADKPQSQEPTATNDVAGLPAPVKEPTGRPPDATAAKIPQKNAPAPALRDESKLSQPAKTESTYPMWTVQVRSSSDKKFAESWVDRLRSKGYDAFIVEGDVQGQTWYRVRVGLLAARQEAEALQNMLASKEGLSETFVLQAVK